MVFFSHLVEMQMAKQSEEYKQIFGPFEFILVFYWNFSPKGVSITYPKLLYKLPNHINCIS